MRNLTFMLVLLALLGHIGLAQQPKKNRTRPLPLPAPVQPVPLPPPNPNQSGRLAVQGPLAELIHDPKLVYVVPIRPLLGCLIELPEPNRNLILTHPDLFSAEEVPLTKKKDSQGPRDPRRIAVKPLKLALVIDGHQIETSLTILLESGRQIVILLKNAPDENQSVYSLRFRDPDLEIKQQAELEAERLAREQQETAQRRETLAKLAAETRLAQVVASMSSASLGTSARIGDATVRLYAEPLNGYLVVALRVARATGNKPVELAAPAWTLDGKPAGDLTTVEELAPFLVTEPTLEAGLIPLRGDSPPASVTVVMAVGKKPLRLTWSLAPPNLTAAGPVAPPPSLSIPKPPVAVNSPAVPVTKSGPPAGTIGDLPQTEQPQPPVPPARLSSAEPAREILDDAAALKRLRYLVDVTFDRSNGAAETLLKVALVRLYGETSGRYLIVTLRLERKLGLEPLTVKNLRWTLGGQPVTPVYATNPFPWTLTTQALYSGFAFALPAGNALLECTLELQGKPVRVARPVAGPGPDLLRAGTTPEPGPETSKLPASQAKPENAVFVRPAKVELPAEPPPSSPVARGDTRPAPPRKLTVGTFSATGLNLLPGSTTGLPPVQKSDIFLADKVPLPPPQVELPVVRPLETAPITTAAAPPEAVHGLSVLPAETAPPPPTPQPVEVRPKTYSISKPQPAGVKPAQVAAAAPDRAEKQRQDRVRAQLKLVLAGPATTPLLKIKEGNVVLKVLTRTTWEGFTIYLFEMVCTDAEVRNLAASYTATNDRIPGFAADYTKEVQFLVSQRDRLEIGDTGRFAVAVEGGRQKMIELTWESGNGSVTVKIQP